LNEKKIVNTLENLGFSSCSETQIKSTNSVWEGLYSGKKYFMKVAQRGTQNFEALSVEFAIFHDVNPQIPCLRFESNDFLVVATSELSSGNQFSTSEVFALISSYESRLLRVSSFLSKELSLELLIDFSRKALSHFKVGEGEGEGQLGDSWVSRLENDLLIVNNFIHQSDHVIVHGDVSPSNILKSTEGLVLIDWGDAFWAFRGFDQLYWLTFLQNSKDLNRDYIAKIDLDFDVCQATLNMIVLLKEFLHRNNMNREHRVSLKTRLERAQFS
jgi:serine/threonine protein kinase